MGIVYRAHDEKLDRTVAIKVIGRETGITPVDRARIVEEARASSALSHPNICTVYEIGEIDGQAYIAMEYVEGRPLSDIQVTAGEVGFRSRFRCAPTKGIRHEDSPAIIYGPGQRILNKTALLFVSA